MENQSFESNEKKDVVKEIIKKYPDWLKEIYKLKYWDLFEYLENIKKEAEQKKFLLCEAGLKEEADIIRFRCYNNDILNIMIKNKNIDIDTTKKQLKIIEKYENYLVDDWDKKDCSNLKKMLQDNLKHLDEEIKFLTELLI